MRKLCLLPKHFSKLPTMLIKAAFLVLKDLILFIQLQKKLVTDRQTEDRTIP